VHSRRAPDPEIPPARRRATPVISAARTISSQENRLSLATMPTPASMSTPASSEVKVVATSSMADCHPGSLAPEAFTPACVGSE